MCEIYFFGAARPILSCGCKCCWTSLSRKVGGRDKKVWYSILGYNGASVWLVRIRGFKTHCFSHNHEFSTTFEALHPENLIETPIKSNRSETSQIMAPRQSRKSQPAAQAAALDEDDNTKQDSQDAEIEVMKRARGMVVDVSVSESHITIATVLNSVSVEEEA